MDGDDDDDFLVVLLRLNETTYAKHLLCGWLIPQSQQKLNAVKEFVYPEKFLWALFFLCVLHDMTGYIFLKDEKYVSNCGKET